MAQTTESLPCLEELVQKGRFQSLLPHFSQFWGLARTRLGGCLLVSHRMSWGCFLCPSWPRVLHGLSTWPLITQRSHPHFLPGWWQSFRSSPGSAASEHHSFQVALRAHPWGMAVRPHQGKGSRWERSQVAAPWVGSLQPAHRRCAPQHSGVTGSSKTTVLQRESCASKGREPPLVFPVVGSAGCRGSL